MSELREQIPLLTGSITHGEGKSWGGKVAVGPRALTTLSAAGQIVRAIKRWLLEHIPTPLGHDELLAR
ncbi:hypothetical protein J14TS5_34240 [Paenibacillus lautus]|uniref:hypothetical protein n=1 Tax=Paenibacillus lautus TaxID=1401 RepID=UPI001B02DD21|nr:hypothetical protein [Paenibacillus lautus]GIO98338.1 hypothetical protein J14TS5_34240 [Paenibacillus lautus]